MQQWRAKIAALESELAELEAEEVAALADDEVIVLDSDGEQV